jgi:hypothetical protein
VNKRHSTLRSRDKDHPHDRKYRSGKSYPLPLWNGILEHCERIGPALWEFVWLVDKITVEKDGMGIVLGGVPVKIDRIAQDLNRCDKTIRTNLDRLEGKNYIKRTRTPFGFTIKVLNSRKFEIWGKKRIGNNYRSLQEGSVENYRSDRQQLPERSAENCRNKEDTAKNTADAVAVGSVVGVGSAVSSTEVCAGDRRHPPSTATAKKADDDRERNLSINEHNRIQQLKAIALSKFMAKHKDIDPVFLVVTLDAIEIRVPKGTKILSAEYFEIALENELLRSQESGLRTGRNRKAGNEHASQDRAAYISSAIEEGRRRAIPADEVIRERQARSTP